VNIVATIIAVELLARMGIFLALARVLEGIAPPRPKALAVVAAQMVNAMSAAASLHVAGVLGDREVVAALVIGIVLSAVPYGLRFLLPYYTGIFGVRDGVRILLLQQSTYMAFVLLAALPLLL
jgi:hypothetical protein